MIKYLSQILLIILCFNAFAQEKTSGTKDYYKEKIRKYIDKDNSLTDYYRIDDDGIFIYASAFDKQNYKTEFRLLWTELNDFKLACKTLPPAMIQSLVSPKNGTFSGTKFPSMQYGRHNNNPEKPLDGWKIAIDPGHTAGNMETAKTESRFLDMKANPLHGLGENVQLSEGMMTYETAIILKQKLVEQGAVVMLTRNKMGESALGISFDDWYKFKFKSTLDSLVSAGKMSAQKRATLLKSSKKQVFTNFFSNIDLVERARKINAFNPDLTIIIHFNVNEKNNGWDKPTEKNFNMCFVPGMFRRSDLSTKEERFNFLRLLATDDLENSMKLSVSMIRSFETVLKVPTVKQKDADYLSEKCLKTDEEGIYVRNLALTRLIKGPLTYGETLYQDSYEECVKLNQRNVSVCDVITSVRITEVAEAYFKGLMDYVNENKH